MKFGKKNQLFQNANKYVYYIIIFVLVVIIYNVCIKLLAYTLDYDKKTIIIKNPFTKEEIRSLQQCAENINSIHTPCFENIQQKIIQKVKERVGTDYMHVSFARFSNNTNPDGQTFHRDIKVKFGHNGTYPNVYTVVTYLDNTVLQMGKKQLHNEPGDIVIFNSFNLHRSLDFNRNKHRRILQFFDVFFDKTEKTEFEKEHSYCQHYETSFIEKYIYPLIDVRIFFEYINLTSINIIDCEKEDYIYNTLLNKSNLCGQIGDIKYYSKF